MFFFYFVLSLRLRVFENRMVRKAFGRKMCEVTGDCKWLQNENTRVLCSSPNVEDQIKKNDDVY